MNKKVKNELKTESKNLAHKLARTFIDELKVLSDERAILLTTHILAEHWINDLIERKSPTSKLVLENFDFNEKLILVYNMGLIPPPIYENISILNRIRNQYAHVLDFKICSEKGLKLMQALHPGPISEVDFTLFPKALAEKKMDSKDVLYWISVVTFGWIHEHCNNDLRSQFQESK